RQSEDLWAANKPVSRCVADWLDKMEAGSYLEKSTIASYRAASARLLTTIGGISIAALTYGDVRSAILLTEQEAPSQARLGLVPVRSALKAAVLEGAISSNVAAAQQASPRAHRQARPMSDDEVRELKTLARESTPLSGSPGSVILPCLIDVLFDTG